LVRIGVSRRNGSPADRIDERGEDVGVIEPLDADPFRQPLVGSDGVPDLQLPHHAQLLAEPVLLE
jgi:hypothetical protein